MNGAADEHPPVEVRWLWRRVYTFGVTLLNNLVVGAIVWRTSDAQTLRWLGLALVGANVVMATLYLAGATVTDWARLARSVRETKTA